MSVGDPDLGSTPSGVSIENTNIFGNKPGLGGGPGQLWPPESIGPRCECWKKLWGAAAGPGPEPADVVCDGRGSMTSIEPVRVTPVDVPSTPLW
jgi:hypothetical protein